MARVTAFVTVAIWYDDDLDPDAVSVEERALADVKSALRREILNPAIHWTAEGDGTEAR